MDIAEGKVGEVGSYEIDFVGGKAVIKVSVVHEFGKVEFVAEGNAVPVLIKGLEHLKTMIPGKVDDVVIDGIIAAVK